LQEGKKVGRAFLTKIVTIEKEFLSAVEHLFKTINQARINSGLNRKFHRQIFIRRIKMIIWSSISISHATADDNHYFQRKSPLDQLRHPRQHPHP
jgi:hypothetical protein